MHFLRDALGHCPKDLQQLVGAAIRPIFRASSLEEARQLLGETVTHLEGKPQPEGYLKAAAALGYDIARCLVVEDAPAGIQAGHAAGAHTLAVATTHSASELSSADAVVPDLTACTVERTADALLLTTTT